MPPHHHNMHRSVIVAVAALHLLCIAPSLLAAEQEPPRRHSLIYRQAPDTAPVELNAASSGGVEPTAPAARPLPRKLTKRPGQSTLTQVTAPIMPAIPMKPTPIGSDSRVSTAPTGLAPAGSSILGMTAPVSSATTVTSLSAASTMPPKPAMAGALAGAGTASTASSVGAVTSGRGLQRLANQMPGLTQLMAPTVSVSAPPPPASYQSALPPASPSSSTLPPPPPSPGTSSATLSWSLNSETDLAGYKIYVGTSSGQYTYSGSPIVVSQTGSYTIAGLPVGQTYYFAISAFDNAGNESALSTEVSKSLY